VEMFDSAVGWAGQMAGETGTFTCTACGKHFAYKPQLEGKRVKCACGNVFTALRDRAEDEYDLAPDDAPSSPRPTPAPAQALPAVAAQHEQPRAAPVQISQDKVLQYAHAPPRREEDMELQKSSSLMNLYLPIAMILIGVVLRIAPFFIHGILQQGTLVMIAAAIGALVVNVVLMLCGVLIASQFLDADFGSLRSAVLKLTATAVVGGGAAGWLLSLDWAHGGVQGPLLALHAMILIYWIMFSMFFELDLLENLFTVAIVMALHIVAFCAVFGGSKI
jgi:hypothetical protein